MITGIALSDPVVRFKFSVSEIELMRRNAAGYAEKFQECENHCANPFCGFPLAPLESHNWVSEVNGSVCEICHTMFFAVKNRSHFVRAQQEWTDYEAKKKRLRKLNE